MGRRTKDGEFSADDVVVLSQARAIRQRPGLYIGDPRSAQGLAQYVLGCLCWGLDEVVAGTASCLEIMVASDGRLSVKDNGAGMPTAKHQSGRPTCEVAMTALMGCRSLKASSEAGRICSEGASMAVVNALSASCVLRIHEAGSLWEMQFERGEISSELRRLGPTPHRGTSISLVPDAALFGRQVLSADFLRPLIADVAERFPCGTIWLQEAMGGESEPASTFEWE